ncbi:MAG: helix-turn-helix transcriptional regulator [Spirochaetes bacterium]|nr:helix-turn-helix transcriptional regulator [Spirochaetota bacterium]
MNEKTFQEIKEESVLDMLDKQYLEAENKNELDYWTPLSKIILESIELRDSKGMSQTDLAKVMKTRQSVISRFENMGRLPNYDFVARLALALDHSPGMTLYGDYMAVVPIEKQSLIKEIADRENVSTRKFVQTMLDREITFKTNTYDEQLMRVDNTNYDTILAFNNCVEKNKSGNENIQDSTKPIAHVIPENKFDIAS